MRWVRFTHDGTLKVGTLDNDIVVVQSGSMFQGPVPTGEVLEPADVTLLPPVDPGKIIGLANNYHALIEKSGGSVPEEPLYFIKVNTSLHQAGVPITRPKRYKGKIIFEGELGLVIGRTCRDVSSEDALACLFGCTCVNDVTAIGLLNKDPGFPQWTRSKAADTFGVIGPVVATGLDLATLRVVTTLNGAERQNYSVTDMVFSPVELISQLSHDMTLEAGDVIACGTSVGVGSMRHDDVVTVTIGGIGSISNRFIDPSAQS
jgi:2-keto-4-pentenoate hydratase/2-oxohepta-3-ene-1,7-dioic acid hydratase in catechol pathway